MKTYYVSRITYYVPGFLGKSYVIRNTSYGFTAEGGEA
jgi:hypothetical protein